MFRRRARPTSPLTLTTFDFAKLDVGGLPPRSRDATVAEARKLGKEQGRSGIPGRQQAYAPGYKKYNDAAEHRMSEVAEHWKKINLVLRGEWCRRRSVLGELEKGLPAAQASVAKAKTRVANKQKLYDERYSALHAEDYTRRFRIGRIPYVLGLVAVFCLDVPLNASVFQIFGEQPWATWVLALFLGIVVVPAAHVFGIQLRHRFSDATAAVLSVAIPLLLIVAVSILREQYVHQYAGLQLNGVEGVFVFIAFNLAVYMSAVFLSYLRHDPHEQALEDAAREVNKATKELEREEAEFSELADAITQVKATLAQIHAWGEEQLGEAKAEAHAERNHFEELMMEYAMANLAARVRPDEPVEALEHTPKPSIPGVLADDAGLEWDCVGVEAVPVPATVS